MHRAPGINAVDQMTKVIGALGNVRFSAQTRDDVVGLPRMIVGGINGGIGHEYGKWRASYMPDYCTIIVEVRGVPGQDWAETRDDIDRALQPLRGSDPPVEYEIQMPPATYVPAWRSMKVPAYGIDVSPDHELPQSILKRHIEVVGSRPQNVGFQDPGSYAWTDAGHFALGGSIPTIYGPSANQQQAVPIENVLNCAKVLALTALDVCS
jgi:acetylornithine deacetylase